MLKRIFIFAITVWSVFLLPTLPGVMAWDQAVLEAVARFRSPELTRIFWAITEIGGGWGFFIGLLLPAIYYLLHHRYRTGIYYLISVGLLKLSGFLLKLGVLRERPPAGLARLSTFSMPSGHGMNAVLIFGVLGIFCLQKIHNPLGRTLAFLACMAAVFLVGFSRIYLGVHYPSDVLMGWLYAASGLWVLQGMKKDLLDFADAGSA